MSEAVRKAMDTVNLDIKAYTCMTDEVLTLILNSKKDELKGSQKLIERIQSRDLYSFVHETVIKDKPVSKIFIFTFGLLCHRYI